MIDQLEAVTLDDFFLQLFDLGIDELDDLAGIDADHVIVVTAIGQLEHGMTAVEVVTINEAGCLELGQDPVDGRQTDILARIHQRLVDIFSAHVTLPRGCRVQHLQNLHARKSDLQTNFAQFAIFNHGLLSLGCCFAASVNPGMIGVSLPSQDSGSHPPMQNAKLMLSSLTLVGLFALAGCSFPGVYKIDIQQGNVVTQDMIDQLKPGMTRRQVRFIMGNPLITDTFHAKRWDYLYSIQPGGRQRYQERVSLTFNDSDQLVALGGDFMPGVSRDQAIMGENGTSSVQPEQPQKQDDNKDEPAKPGSLLEQIQRDVDSAEPVPVPVPEPLEQSPQ